MSHIITTITVAVLVRSIRPRPTEERFRTVTVPPRIGKYPPLDVTPLAFFEESVESAEVTRGKIVLILGFVCQSLLLAFLTFLQDIRQFPGLVNFAPAVA